MSFAQSHRIYFSAGYNIPTTTAVIGNFQSNDSYQQYISTYGEGISYQGGYQFSVTNNFAIDLNFNYLPGFKNGKYFVKSVAGDWSYTNSNISISPSINIKFDIGNFSPYTKFGFSVNSISLNTKRGRGGLQNMAYDFSYKEDFTLGIVGGLGINYSIDKTFVGFVEAQLNSITYYPDEMEETAYYNDGSKVTTKYKLEDKVNIDLNSGNILPSQDFPFSSFGLIIGLRIVL
jgi:hypothetical protein